MEEHCNKSKKKSSVVWKHFTLIPGENAVICLYCKRKVKLSGSRSTTPLNVHLRNRHPSVLPSVRSRVHGNVSKKWSIVWRHFKLISEGNAVLCLHCKTEFKFSASRTTSPLHVHLRNRHPSVLPLAQSRVGLHRKVSRKTSNVWSHFKFISEENAALCLHCKKKLAASRTSPLHVHLRNRHPFVLSGELHNPQVVSESEEKVLESERTSNDPTDSNQLLKFQVEKLQKSLEEKDKEVTETYKSFQQIIQAVKENVKSMKEQLIQQTGKHQDIRQGRLFDTVPPAAASSRHNRPHSSDHEACEDRPLLTLSCTSEPSSPGFDDTEGSAQRSSKDQEVEKRHGRQDNEEDEDCNHNKDEVSDYYPEIDPDYRPEEGDDRDDPGEDFGESNYEGEDNEDEGDIGGSDDNNDNRKGPDYNLEDDGNSSDNNPDNQARLSSSKDANNISPTNDLENKTGEVYSCTLCNETFIKVYYVKLHRLIHDKGATLNQCLSEPMKYVRVVQPYKCEVCGEEHSTSEGLHIHQRLHDEENGHCELDARGQKLYKCRKCDESFNHSTDFCHHQGVHLDEMARYVCSWCEKTFVYPADLSVHQKCHCEKRQTEANSPSNLRPYLCDTCGKAFENLSHLKRHVMVHTGEKPHKCLVCDKRFRFHFSLKQHSLKHSENSPFMCHICGKGFTRLLYVQKHMRVHTKEKPYHCSFCAKDFGYQESLYVHHKRFHSVSGQ